MPNIDEIRIVGQEITYDIRPKEDASHQNVSAEEKAQWNAKSDFSGNYADLQGKPDLSQFVTKAVDDLTNYYLKSETYTKQEVQQLLSSFNSGVFRLVDTLPTASAATTGLKIYLVPSQTQEAQNVKDEFITIEENGSYRWEQIGSTAMSLDGYVTETALNQALSSYVTSSAFTSALAQKQDKLVSGENIKTVNGESILGSGNIVAGDPNAIKYTEQSLTDEQKAQARQNIGAGTSDFSGDPIVSITVPDPYDGSLIFTKASGDTVTVDLNHQHLAYPKYELMEDEAEYQAIATKESDKLYLIPETSA